MNAVTLVPDFPDRRCASCDALGRGCLVHVREEPLGTLRPAFPACGRIASKQIRETVSKIRRRKVTFRFGPESMESVDKLIAQGRMDVRYVLDPETRYFCPTMEPK